MQRDELAAWLRLTAADGIGNTTVRRLLAAFGLPQAVLAQSHASLRHFLSQAQTLALQTPPEGFDDLLQRSADWLARPDCRILTLADAGYPAGLLQIEDPPPLLYLLGRLDLSGWSDRRGIAIVGSRNPTPQGAANARQFGRALAQAGLTVVSGLALGVDGAAHEGALEGGGETLAVVGTGLDRVYPRQHRELAHRIGQQGLLVSEFPLGTPPLSPNFPRRNRIIAALTQGTLVVEAALESGSLITARQAAEQGKEVFAIPGSIHSPQSRGCHALIRQGAKLVEAAQDVLEELKLGPGATPRQDPRADADTAHVSPSDQSLLSVMGHDPVSLDALIARSGVAAAQLQADLLGLELQGFVARLPGGLFQRIANS